MKTMINYLSKGQNLRLEIKDLVYEYMKNSSQCQPNAEGKTQAEIFRACGLDWGEYPNATSSNQQYWIVALLRELEKEEKIERDNITKRLRIK